MYINIGGIPKKALLKSILTALPSDKINKNKTYSTKVPITTVKKIYFLIVLLYFYTKNKISFP